MKALGISNPGLMRENNEDYYFINREKGLLIVADGMGGHAAGEEASKLAVQTVVGQLADYQCLPEKSIKAALTAANKAIFAKSADNPALAGMGTTLTLIAVLPEYLVTGHVGDSMAYLIDAKGMLPLTSDHSVSGQLLAMGKITSAEAACHPQRHVLTRALGIDECIDVETRRQAWRSGQKLLLCSDGLTDIVSASEIYQIVQGDDDLAAQINSLLALVLERGAPDNVTIILAQL
jgi:protein phosphatase